MSATGFRPSVWYKGGSAIHWELNGEKHTLTLEEARDLMRDLANALIDADKCRKVLDIGNKVKITCTLDHRHQGDHQGQVAGIGAHATISWPRR